MGEEFDPLSLLTQDRDKPQGGVKPPRELDRETVEEHSKTEEESKVVVPNKDKQQAYLDQLHEELAKAANGRTEDQIGLKDSYWAVRNRLQAYLHSLKG